MSPSSLLLRFSRIRLTGMTKGVLATGIPKGVFSTPSGVGIPKGLFSFTEELFSFRKIAEEIVVATKIAEEIAATKILESQDDFEWDQTKHGVCRSPWARIPQKANRGAKPRSKVMKRIKLRIKTGRNSKFT